MYQRDALSLIVDDSAAQLSEGELSERLESQLAGLSDLERESFDDVMRTIGSGAQTALPGVIQGASTGAAAGPWGALIGGLAGGAISLATSSGAQGRGGQAAPPPRPTYKPPPQPAYTPPPTPSYTPPAPSSYSPPPQPSWATPIGQPQPAWTMSPSSSPSASPSASSSVSPPPSPTPGAPPSASSPGSDGATLSTSQPSATSAPNPAGQLLWAMQNPRVLQAIASLVAGPLGRQQVPVGQTTAPPAAFLNLLNVLAAQASERAEAYAEGGQDAYLRDAEGDYAWDVVNPEARARALLVHLQRDARAAPPRGEAAGAWLLSSGLVELEPAAAW